MIRCNIYRDEMKKELLGTIQDVFMPIMRVERASPTSKNNVLISWKIAGNYIGEFTPQNIEFYEIEIITQAGVCCGKAFWQSFYPDGEPTTSSKWRGLIQFVGTGKLEGSLDAIKFLQPEL